MRISNFRAPDVARPEIVRTGQVLVRTPGKQRFAFWPQNRAMSEDLNLLTPLDFVPPRLSSNPRIWHWNRYPCGQSELSRDSSARSAGQSPSPETSGSGPPGDAPESPSSPASTSRSRMDPRFARFQKLSISVGLFSSEFSAKAASPACQKYRQRW